MREILFRGKRVDNGEWVEGYYVYDNSGQTTEHPTAYIVHLNKHPCGWSLIPFEVIPDTVGQDTGLTDKNGKKIFEGDIVKTNKFNEPNKKYIIKYNLQFGAFIGEDKYHMYFTTFDGDSDQFEVIGNIHDNPELLEVSDA